MMMMMMMIVGCDVKFRTIFYDIISFQLNVIRCNMTVVLSNLFYLHFRFIITIISVFSINSPVD
jgi:hypothetical protein